MRQKPRQLYKLDGMNRGVDKMNSHSTAAVEAFSTNDVLMIFLTWKLSICLHSELYAALDPSLNSSSSGVSELDESSLFAREDGAISLGCSDIASTVI